MIEKLLAQNEGQTLEFKESTKSLLPIIKAVVAFANTAGGVIVIGVEDKSKKIIGYSVEPGRKITEKLKKYPEVHISPCSYDSDESRTNVKNIWVENMVSALKGNPKNIWVGTK